MAVQNVNLYSNFKNWETKVSTCAYEDDKKQQEFSLKINEAKAKGDNLTQEEYDELVSKYASLGEEYQAQLEEVGNFDITDNNKTSKEDAYKALAQGQIANGDIENKAYGLIKDGKLSTAEFFMEDLTNVPEEMLGEFITNPDKFYEALNKGDKFGAALLLANADCGLMKDYFTDKMETFDTLDANEDGYLDENELSEYYAKYDEMDGKKDGMFTITD